MVEAFESEDFRLLYKFTDKIPEEHFAKADRAFKKKKNNILVVDLGSFETRAGFSGEKEPRLVFKSRVARVKYKKSGEDADRVGDLIPQQDEIVKMTIKSPFDKQVVIHSAPLQAILQYIFEALGQCSDVIITECLCNPISCRKEIAGILFEQFKVEKVCFAVDSLLAKYYNNVQDSSLVINLSNEACTILPVFKGVPLYDKACRLDVGGLQCKEFLRKILWIKYPHLKALLSPERIDVLFQTFGRVALDYIEEIQNLPSDHCKTIQFDFDFTEKKEISEDEKVKKLQRKKEVTDKLKVLAQERRVAKMEEDKKNLEYFEDLIRKKEENDVTESDFETQIEESGFDDEADFMKYIKNLRKKVQEREKKTDEAGEVEEEETPDLSEKFHLVDIPDEELAPEQLKEKRRQKLMKAGVEARLRRQEEKKKREKELQDMKEAQRRSYEENPEEFMKSLLTKRKNLLDDRNQRKKSKTMLADRKSELSKRRIQVLADLGKSMNPDQEMNDSFGASDADWDVYRQVQVNEEDEFQSEDEKARIKEVDDLIKEFDPSQLPSEEIEGAQQVMVTDKKSVAKYFQAEMNIERIRVTEALFQPSMIGVDQAGLAECVSFVSARLTEEEKNAILPNVFICGGLASLPGLVERLEREIQMTAPYGSTVKVVRAQDPRLDSWKGASLVSQLREFPSFCISSESDEQPRHSFGNDE